MELKLNVNEDIHDLRDKNIYELYNKNEEFIKTIELKGTPPDRLEYEGKGYLLRYKFSDDPVLFYQAED